MGKSKKIIFNLTIDDLRELGIIGKKRKKGRKGRNKKRILLIDPQTGAIIGDAKSDSSHMVGTTQTIQPSNSNNVSTAIQQANLEAIENANKRAKDQRQWLIDNGIDPNDPTIGLQTQDRFPDRNTTKLLEGFGASVSGELEQMKQHYDNQLLGYQNRFTQQDKTNSNFRKTIDDGIKLLNQTSLYSLSDSAGAFGGTKGSDAFKSNNTSKAMNDINNTPTRFTPLKEPTPESSPLIEVIDNKIPLKSNDQVYQEEVMKHDNDVNYSEPVAKETFNERMDREYKEAQQQDEEDEEDAEDINVEDVTVVKAKSNVGKNVGGRLVKNSGRRSIGFGKVKVIAPKSDLQILRDSAIELFDKKSGLIDDRKYRRMENEIRTGQSKTVRKVIDELNQLGKK